MNACDSGKPIWRMYFAYARSTTISSRRQARRDDEPVEVVVLDLAAEDARERVLEHRVQRVDLDLGVGDRGLHAEVVHPYGRRVDRRDPVRALVDHLEAHALEHRQAVRQRHRRAAVEELEAQHAGRRLQRPVERQRKRRVRRQRRHQRDVGHRGARGESPRDSRPETRCRTAGRARCRAPRPARRSARREDRPPIGARRRRGAPRARARRTAGSCPASCAP